MRYFSRDLWVECWSSQDSCASNSQGFESFTVPFKVLVLKGVLCVRRKDRPGCELSDLAHRAAEWHLRHCNTGLVTEILQQRSSCRKVLQQRSCCRIFFATEILLQIFFCNKDIVTDFLQRSSCCRFFFSTKILLQENTREENQREGHGWRERCVRRERREGERGSQRSAMGDRSGKRGLRREEDERRKGVGGGVLWRGGDRARICCVAEWWRL